MEIKEKNISFTHNNKKFDCFDVETIKMWSFYDGHYDILYCKKMICDHPIDINDLKKVNFNYLNLNFELWIMSYSPTKCKYIFNYVEFYIIAIPCTRKILYV